MVLDALEVGKGPVAMVHLPLRLKLGLHGNWVDEREIQEWEARRRDGREAPVRVAEAKLPWQEEMLGQGRSDPADGVNGLNGVNGTH